MYHDPMTEPAIEVTQVSKSDPILAEVGRDRIKWSELKNLEPRVIYINIKDPKARRTRVANMQRSAARQAKIYGMTSKSNSGWVNGRFVLTVQFFLPEGSKGPSLIKENTARGRIKDATKKRNWKAARAAEEGTD